VFIRPQHARSGLRQDLVKEGVGDIPCEQALAALAER
jgi:hypothetical protein